MAKIRKLDKFVAELIAAGEVIERPASAVKEMVENSIDAGAKAITVQISGGGIKYIRITDDGIGMDREDVKTAFLRNATSKIYTEDDLNHIGTLGFRGEALASICAVSKVTIKTRTAENQIGTKLSVMGGEFGEVEDIGCEVGTHIEVKEIFYNTPARLKFLKSDRAEGNAVASCMDRLALSNPHISFKFIRDGKNVLITPGNGDLLATIYAVFGKEFANSLIEVDNTNENVKVSGYVSKPEFSRGSRGMQFFFVNGRFVQTKTGIAALEEAYKNEVMVHKFPACVLFIDLPNELTDVNTHPAKIEIRFMNEKNVYDAVYFATREALLSDKQAPEIVMKRNPQKVLMQNDAIGHEAKKQTTLYEKKEPERKIEIPKSKDRDYSFDQMISKYEKNNDKLALNQPKTEYKSDIQIKTPTYIKPETKKASNIEEIENTKIEESSLYAHAKYIGEVFKTYAIIEKGDAIYFIDKHAAHERIIFEDLKKKRDTSDTQILISPVSVTLPKDEYNIILEFSDELSNRGFFIDDFGTGTILVRGFPVELSDENIKETIEEIASTLISGSRNITPHAWDDLLHSVACKAAIKGNDVSSKDELLTLIEMLEENDEIRHCPHGRPIVTMLTQKEIEKRFGRI